MNLVSVSPLHSLAVLRGGFGVFWEAVARAANNWEDAVAFSGWTVKDLITELEAGNPVIVWGTLPKATLTDCSWYTKDGELITAYRETHVRVAIGFLGPLKDPTHIILNDPIAGRLYWSPSQFQQNWEAFDSSGVVIR